MIVMLLLRWWYSDGWRWVWRRSAVERVQWLNEAFSVSALIGTWFSPFKQTYSNANKGSIDSRIRAVVDNFVSRFVGSLLRTVIIFVGFTGMILALLFGLISVLLWPAIPASPVIAFILYISGAGV